MIRGKKNFLPPHPLIMGFGLLFRLDESSLGSHLNERRVRGEEEGIDDVDKSGPLNEESNSESETDEKLEEESKNIPSSSTNLPKPVVESQSEVNSSQNVLSISNAEAMESHEFSVRDRNALTSVDSVTSQLEDLIDRALGLGSATTSDKIYNSETSRTELVEENNHEEQKGAARDKPYISKAERRKLKKGQNNVEANMEQKDERSKEKGASFSQPEKNVHDGKPGSGKLSRGQRGKLKKMKEKYADQDEEERSIRMALLAVSTTS